MEERVRKAQREMTDATNAMMSEWLNRVLRGIIDDPVMSQLWSAMKMGNRAKPQIVIDPYRVLGIEKTATDDQVKKRYRELARYFHPDTAAVRGTGFFFLQVQAAYEAICKERGWR